MMAKRNRALIGIASIALGLMFVLPVWTIQLEAPQYPEGLGMVIRLNTIEGQKQHDLNNINNLNHYIGMQRIEPESIPELRLMPWIVALLMVGGGLVSLVGRRRMLYAWTALFLGLSLAGMVDFWKWEYDYGHDLDEENAIIKIPGMSYQPPLIGSRQILNFTAHSWPGAGGWIAILVAVTAVGVSAIELRRRDRREPIPSPECSGESGGRTPRAERTGAVVAGTLLLLTASGCREPAPRPLAAGIDACGDCLMVLDDGAHGTELVSSTGRIYTFDSVECLVNHLTTQVDLEVHSAWVTDFSNPADLVPAAEAFYLVSPTLASPMGLGVTAFARSEDRDGAVHAFGGEALDWSGVREVVGRAWPEGRPRAHGGHTESLTPAG